MINEQGGDMNTSFKVIQNLRGRWIDRHIILSSTNFQFTKKEKKMERRRGKEMEERKTLGKKEGTNKRVTKRKVDRKKE